MQKRKYLKLLTANNNISNNMVTLNLGEIEFETKADIVNTLNEIANSIDYGYSSGITCGGVCWDIEGNEESDEESEED